ncbi:hypothetical protein V5799_029383 [Amblyomma americanum]|uniref:Uncharacterized protein n=1 Tax=Amblyomma americanum TaxID=6943 RepID=A0AAQ4ERD5_AMBAM
MGCSRKSTAAGRGHLANTIYTLCRSVGAVTGTVSKLSHGLLGGILSPVLGVATSALPLSDCSGLNTHNKIMCGQPLRYQLASALNIGKCLNTTLSVCVGTHPNEVWRAPCKTGAFTRS